MILTDKAREDFIKYASYTYGEDSGDLNMMREVMRNTLIIDWFDSLCASKLGGHNMSDYLYEYLKRHNYKESIRLTIKRLNTIYNEKYK